MATDDEVSRDPTPGEDLGVAHDLPPIVAIGASAGGLEALQELVHELPDDSGVCFVVIQHLAPDHESIMDELLGSHTPVDVKKIEDGAQPAANCVFVNPPGPSVLIEDGVFRLRKREEEAGLRTPIDQFFKSVAKTCGRDSVCVVLSGTGSDGTDGLRAVKASGGMAIVQKSDSARFPGMPDSAAATGLVDFVLRPKDMAACISEIIDHREALNGERDSDSRYREIEEHLNAILDAVADEDGPDFGKYKPGTLVRRIDRRMMLRRQRTVEGYVGALKREEDERSRLLQDFLIGVTRFFRDGEAFDELARCAIAPMVDTDQEDFRIWVPGCSTGEEAYTLAILMIEAMETANDRRPVKIFGTDIDLAALRHARAGHYNIGAVADLSEARRERFFRKDNGRYRVAQELRDSVVFAPHNLVEDPPFSRLDLVTCRNLLIYLNDRTQANVIPRFHYALNPGGYLFLGSAESVDPSPELFTPSDREARVYAAKAGAGRGLDVMTELPREHRPRLPSISQSDREPSPAPSLATHMAALEDFAPPSALVDDQNRILNLSRNAGHFIRPPEGPYTSELTSVVREELRSELKRALNRAFSVGEPALTLPVTVGFNGSARRVIIHVQPVDQDSRQYRQALVLFIDSGSASQDDTRPDDLPDEGSDSERIRELENELRMTQERLSATRREHESSIQELKISNEELQSVNEEYRSTAEELETSKEELQSINEELSTVNSELKNKLDTIASAHSDLQNLINATEIGTLFLDSKLKIKMLTPAVEQLFNVTDSDVGRPITDFTHKLTYDGVESDAKKVLRDLAPVESEVKTSDGRWLMMHLRPYRTVEDRIEGVVLSFVDITARREAKERLRESERRYRRLFESIDEGYLLAKVIRDEAGAPVDIFYCEANPAAVRLVEADFEGRRLSEIPGDFEPYWWELPGRVLDTGEPERAELFASPLERWFEIGVTKVDSDRIAMLFKDITDRKTHERERELMVGELNHRVKNVLAVVQSIASQTARTTHDPDDFKTAFQYRIQALTQAHRLLTERNWGGTDLRGLIEAVVESFVDGEDNVQLDGPRVKISPKAVVSLSMAFHELATNAVKYGALSGDGSVELSWEFAGDGETGDYLRLTWSEKDGPEVTPPDRKGFGRQILERAIPYELGGETELDYRPDGLVCRMSFPAERVLSDEPG